MLGKLKVEFTRTRPRRSNVERPVDSEPPSSSSAAPSTAEGRRHRRRAWLTLAAVAVAMGSYQGLRSLVTPSRQEPPKFTMQAEPRPLPVIVFADGDGRSTDLAPLRGMVVLLNIWATWPRYPP